MGLFDGVIFCSDFDGTLAVKGKISQENCDAIAYFQKEGGIFCPTSGRRAPFFHKCAKYFKTNGPVIVLNGSMILSYGETPEEDTVLYESIIPDALARAYAKKIMTLPGVKKIALHERMAPVLLTVDGTDKPFTELESAEGQFRKIAVEHEVGMVDLLREAVEPEFGAHFFFSCSSDHIYEAQMIGSDKGSSVLRAKAFAKAHTLVCAGDYENDIPMIRAADIGYAVGDAQENVKAAADRVTVPCAEHAIREIIRDLEREARKKL